MTGEFPDILSVDTDTVEPAPLDMRAAPRALRGEAAVGATLSFTLPDDP